MAIPREVEVTEVSAVRGPARLVRAWPLPV